MAGVLGFEPRYAEIKTLCLTAWRHPYNVDSQLSLQAKNLSCSSLQSDAYFAMLLS